MRTLYAPGATRILDEELASYHIDLVCLQETRWLKQGTHKEKNFTYFYSGNNNNKHERGVAIAVANKLCHNVLDFKPINERLMILRIKGHFNNISIISYYAPTEDKEDEIKDDFYDALETVYLTLPSYDTKLLMGDANAKIGREEIWKPIIGQHSLHESTNNNGTRLINFASSKELRIMSTYFPHKNIHKRTWTSPDQQIHNQIDHILIDLRHRNIIQDVRNYRGAEIGSDHYLVMVKVRERIALKRKEKKEKVLKINLETLKDENVIKMYQNKLEQKDEL